ncbi:MAG: hypothetical protein NT073_27515, partial [Spirosoma sp.]|nr:hypothetical protein [Spirosoma sp.]
QLDPVGCESDRAAIAVTVYPRPAAPTTTNLSVCQNTTPVSLLSSVSAVGTLKWYADASTTTFSLVAPTPPTTTVGAVTYYVSQTSADGCESDRTSITFTVVALPAAPAVSPTPVTYCQDVTAVPLVATATPGGTLNWYDVATGGTSVASLIPSTAASANYYVSQTVNGCEGPRATINVIINAKPARPAVTTPVAYCQQATASPLSATAGAGNSLRWYGTAVTLGTATVVATVPQTATPGLLNYYVSQLDPVGCESDRAAIAVTVYPRPAAPTTTNLSVCQNTTPVSLLSSVSARYT